MRSLRGQVTAGLYVGQSEKEPLEDMGHTHIISHKETLRAHPPDILLTNYKMLDYLLIRPKDRSLWEENTPETLSYLVVDELHTFDGAQGTDLACLIRRLKARLGTPSGWLCCVGTSATLGDTSEHEQLRNYAGEIFGEPFDDQAVIDESRLSAGEFLGDSLIAHLALPFYEDAPLLSADGYTTVADYLAGQYRLWFGEPVAGETVTADEWRIELGQRLKNHLFFQNLLKVLGNRPREYAEVLAELGAGDAGVEAGAGRLRNRRSHQPAGPDLGGAAAAVPDPSSRFSTCACSSGCGSCAAWSARCLSSRGWPLRTI